MIVISIFLALLCYYLHSEIVSTLKNNKIKVNNSNMGITNTKNLYQLLKREKDLSKKFHYGILLSIFIGFFLLFILTLISLIRSL